MLEVLNVLRSLPHLYNPSSGERYAESNFFNAANCYPYYVRAAELIKPQRILEIGSLLGFGLISFSVGFLGCQEIVSVDNESYVPHSRRFCLENFEAAWRQMALTEEQLAKKTQPEISFHAHYSELMRRNRRAEDGFDLIHVDGDHSYEGAIADMLFSWSLKPRFMLVDDYYSIDSVRVAVDSWARYYNVPFKVWDSFRGWAIFASDESDLDRLPDTLS